MGTRDQLLKKQSEIVPSDGTNVAEVISLVVTGPPSAGAQFAITPHRFVVSSSIATGAGAFRADGRWQILSSANISAAYSALSAQINLAMATGEGVVATAGAFRTDIALTAALPGTEIEVQSDDATIVFTETTGNTGGHTLGEGFEYLITSAGAGIAVRDPAEKTKYQLQNKAQLGKNSGEYNKIQDNANQA